ncbi:hypothetical protein OAO42_01225 [Candidatus Izimaplasma bacterium]|nr:hypothetical protein [Candidatus Izimaplasma bacterium]
MKRLLVSIMFLFVLVGCGPKLSEFEQALANMEEVDNFTMELAIRDIPFIGTITADMKFEEDKLEMSMLGMTEYGLIVDGVEYTIIDIDGITFFEEVVVEDVDDDLFEGIGEDFDFVEDEFEYDEEDGYYHAISDLEEMENLRIKIEDGYITEMLFTIEAEGIEMNFEVGFEDFGTTVIEDFPNIEGAEKLINALNTFDDLGYNLHREETVGFDFLSPAMNFSINLEGEKIVIKLTGDSPDLYNYDYETEMFDLFFEPEDTPKSYAELLEDNPLYEDFTEELQAIIDVYEYLTK